MAQKMSVEDQIKHFLRLAEDKSATQAERDTASAQAERLMAKHLIDRLSLDLDSDRVKIEEIVKRYVWFPGAGGSISFDMMTGMCEVVRAMECYPYYVDHRSSKRYIRETGRMQGGVLMAVVGFESDADAAVQMIKSFQVQAPIALRAWQKSPEWNVRTYWMDKADKWRVSLSFLRAFGAGAASRIRETRKSVLNEYDDRTALVLVDRSQQVVDHVAANTNLSTREDRRRLSNQGAAAGHLAGRSAAGANQQGALRQGRGISA